MSVLEQFPIIGALNVYRYAAFQVSHDFQEPSATGPKPVAEKIVSWLGHKAISVICIPANSVAIGLGVIGMTLTASTLGALKVAVFAVTLGAVKPEFSIGFLWLGERTITSAVELLSNAGELAYDAGDLAYQGYKGVRWVLSALKLDYISTLLRQIADVVLDRIALGFERAQRDETNLPFKDLFPSPIRALDTATYERSCLHDDQSMQRWFEHKVLSVVNIPANTVLFAVSGIGYLVGLSAFVSKVALYAIANVCVPVPIGYSAVAGVAGTSGFNVVRNSLEVVLDIGVPAYKLASALHLTRLAATVRDFVGYTFRAICS